MTRLRGILDPEAVDGHSADHGYEAVRLERLQPAGVPHDGGRDGRLSDTLTPCASYRASETLSSSGRMLVCS